MAIFKGCCCRRKYRWAICSVKSVVKNKNSAVSSTESIESNEHYFSSQDLVVPLWLLFYQFFSVVEYYWANYVSSLWQVTTIKAPVKFSWTARNKISVVCELWIKSVVESTNLNWRRGSWYAFSSVKSSEENFLPTVNIMGLVVGWVLSQNTAVHQICIQTGNVFAKPVLK